MPVFNNDIVELRPTSRARGSNRKLLSACSVRESRLAYRARAFGQQCAYLSSGMLVISVRRIGSCGVSCVLQRSRDHELPEKFCNV